MRHLTLSGSSYVFSPDDAHSDLAIPEVYMSETRQTPTPCGQSRGQHVLDDADTNAPDHGPEVQLMDRRDARPPKDDDQTSTLSVLVTNLSSDVVNVRKGEIIGTVQAAHKVQRVSYSAAAENCL